MNRAEPALSVTVESKHAFESSIASHAPARVDARRDGTFLASGDPALLDLDAIHAALSTQYWSQGIPRSVLARAIAHSLAFGLYDTAHRRSPSPDAHPIQIGFCRIVTDHATYGYLADVYILKPYRGRGLSNLLLTAAFAHPDLTHLRRINLMTRDAHHVYSAFGFAPPSNPAGCMEIVCRDMYQAAARGFPQPSWST